MTFDEIVHAFGAVHHRRGYYRFCCKLHDDNRASAEVWERNGVPVWGCWCCSHGASPGEQRQVRERMLHAAGLTWRDVLGDREMENRERGKIVATYDYVDEFGEVLYQKLRYLPKDFKCRSPKPNGGWEYFLIEGGRRVLYRFPELLEHIAMRPDEWIVLTAGEKDADNGAKVGLSTTTNVEGEGVWLDQYSVVLAGCKVAIFPDHDEVGWKRAGAVCFSLRRHGCDVVIMDVPDLPPKGDLTDFLERYKGHGAGTARNAAKRLISTAHVWKGYTNDSTHQRD